MEPKLAEYRPTHQVERPEDVGLDDRVKAVAVVADCLDVLQGVSGVSGVGRTQRCWSSTRFTPLDTSPDKSIGLTELEGRGSRGLGPSVAGVVVVHGA